MALFDQIRNILNQRVISGAEFDELLTNCIKDSGNLLTGIQYKCIHCPNGKSFQYGRAGEGDCQASTSADIENGVHVSVFLWGDSKSIADMAPQAVDLFKLFWNDGCMNDKSRLLTSTHEKVQKKCEAALAWNASNQWKTAVFVMDLDNFSDVNNKYTAEDGDRVILEFANVILAANRSRGILIHNSGDEFYLLYTYQSPSDVLKLAWDIRSELDAHTFQGIEVGLTVAMGVKLLECGETDFRQAFADAGALYKASHRNGTKQRDSIRISKQKNTLADSDDRRFKLAASRVLANLFHEGVFHNIYLDYLSDRLCREEPAEGLREKICAFLKWINYSDSTTLRCCRGGNKWDTSEKISNGEIGFAIFHGLLNNHNLCGKTVCADFGTNEDKLLRISVDGLQVYNSEKEVSYNEKLEKRVSTFAPVSLAGRDVAKRTVLLQAGYETESFPEDIFYKVVKVDKRPHTGGGLPDLWSAALCSLISAMKENPNFKDIVIYGDTCHTQEITTYLTNLEEWGNGDPKFSFDYINRKTYQSNSDILALKERFSGHIKMAATENELLELLFTQYNTDDLDYTTTLQPLPGEPKRTLKRDLNDVDVQLGIYDGCVAASLQDVFPLVLEILRKKYLSGNFSRAIDQAGRELLELTNFKITLTRPKETDFPDYYRDEVDREKMRKYYEHEFMNEEEGLFRKALEEDSQLESMLQHVVKAIENRKTLHTTRRAILVVPVPPINSPSDQYSPLGLVSVWLCPRYNDEENKVVIDFSYTWRTVEALVGLPHSLYASVNFSAYLLQEIRKRLEAARSETSVRMGQVSYIAYSLHMFLDKDSLNIVRGIVNEASI